MRKNKKKELEMSVSSWNLKLRTAKVHILTFVTNLLKISRTKSKRMLMISLLLLFSIMMIYVRGEPIVNIQQVDGDPNCSCVCSVPVCANRLQTFEPSFESVAIPTSSPSISNSPIDSNAPTIVSSAPTESFEPTALNTVSIPAFRPTKSPMILA